MTQLFINPLADCRRKKGCTVPLTLDARRPASRTNVHFVPKKVSLSCLNTWSKINIFNNLWYIVFEVEFTLVLHYCKSLVLLTTFWTSRDSVVTVNRWVRWANGAKYSQDYVYPDIHLIIFGTQNLEESVPEFSMKPNSIWYFTIAS